MQWQDVGFLLSSRSLGESKVIATFLTKEHGVTAAVARVTKKLGHAPYQQGNSAEITWFGRISEQLGRWNIEVHDIPSARMMNDQLRILVLSSSCFLIQMLMPERNPCQPTYDALAKLIDQLDSNLPPIACYCSFEVQILKHLGFGLDLSKCAATGTTENLTYISPKTGRAVSKEAGQPYHSQLFPLLPWFSDHSLPLCSQDYLKVLQITKHFISTHIIEKYHELPQQRELITRILADK